ncbi:MAG: DUF99 family protein [Candidatus Thorarchaeota archaeon]
MSERIDLFSEDMPSAERPEAWKKGARVLGVAESFHKEDARSHAIGLVMRGDYRIDGFGLCRPTVGGNDATEQILGMYSRIKRQDIRAWMLGGGIISWFNVVDNVMLHEETGIPVVCVSYYDSEGLDKYLHEYFPDDWQERQKAIEKNGERHSVILNNGYKLFLNTIGMTLKEAKILVNRFTIEGRVPEPIRVARTIAASLRRDALATSND